MTRSTILVASLTLALIPGLALAEADSAPPTETVSSSSGPMLAPGVARSIPADHQYAETVTRHDLVELHTPDLKWTPNYTPESRTLYEMAEGAEFRRPIWALRFTFKPLRMIYVDIPQPTGKMQRKLVWYMVYNVRNTGEEIVPTKKDDGTYEVQKSAKEITFIPTFVLKSHEFDKTYLDRVIPAALAPIERREVPHHKLLTSVEMADTPIPVSTERDDRPVWGVAMWEDVDPRIDYFSVYVEGLSNAYRTELDPRVQRTADDPPGKGRRFNRKTLQLNFWRPGDTVDENEEEIRFGTPLGREALYGVEPGVDYTWVYR